MADEPVRSVQLLAAVAIRDEDLLALSDVFHDREGHHLLTVVPCVLGVAPGVARMVEVGRNRQDDPAAVCDLEAETDEICSVIGEKRAGAIQKTRRSTYLFALYFLETGCLCNLS